MKQFDIITNFSSLYELIMYFDSEEKCEEHLANLRWNDEPKCPSCSKKNVSMLKGKRKQYKCYGCKRKFSVKTGSVFQDSKLPLLKWFVAIYLFTSHKRGISSHQLAKDVKVSQKTAWFMLHRIRVIFEGKNDVKLDGEVQIDETYVGGDMKNMSNAKRAKIHEEKRQTGMEHKAAVLGLMDKDEVIAMPIPKSNKENILPIIDKLVDKKAIVITDGFGAYRAVGKTHARHVIVMHSAGEYVKDGFSTNNIENFWSHFKRTIVGTYFHMSDWHLAAYVDESTYRFNTRDLGEGERFDLTLANSNKTLSWNELVKKGKNRA